MSHIAMLFTVSFVLFSICIVNVTIAPTFGASPVVVSVMSRSTGDGIGVDVTVYVAVYVAVLVYVAVSVHVAVAVFVSVWLGVSVYVIVCVYVGVALCVWDCVAL